MLRKKYNSYIFLHFANVYQFSSCVFRIFTALKKALQHTQEQHKVANQNSSSDLGLKLATSGTTVRCVNLKAITATDNLQFSQTIGCFKVMQ